MDGPPRGLLRPGLRLGLPPGPQLGARSLGAGGRPLAPGPPPSGASSADAGDQHAPRCAQLDLLKSTRSLVAP